MNYSHLIGYVTYIAVASVKADDEQVTEHVGSETEQARLVCI